MEVRLYPQASTVIVIIVLSNPNPSAVAMPDLNQAIGDQQVSYWIGLDGIDDGSNLNQIVIQAGFDAIKKQDGTVEYKAFYEWYPDPATFIPADQFFVNEDDSKCPLICYPNIRANLGGRRVGLKSCSARVQ